MKRLVLSILSLCLVLTFAHPSHTQPQSCKSGNTLNTAYMMRTKDKRCEGITTPNVARSDFGLHSLSIGKIQNGSKLALEIPKFASLTKPQIQVQSTRRYYQLKPLEFKENSDKWIFQWSDTILRREKINLSSLRSLAEVGSEQIVLPVRFSSSSNYDIRIYTGNRTKRISLKILDSNGSSIYTKTKTDQPGKEVLFRWNGRTSQGEQVPLGLYTLRVEAEVERSNSPSERRISTRKFAHNPKWLQ